MNGLDIHVGESFDDIARRVSDAWHRAERGEAVSENHLTFESWEGLAQIMTGERLQLLKHLHRTPTSSLESLASALKRDRDRVATDVDVLVEAGLIDRDAFGLRAEYDEIRTVLTL